MPITRRLFIDALARSAAVGWGLNATGQGQDRAARDTFAGGSAGQPRTIQGIALRWCPAGAFMMGSPASETGRRADEAQVRVTLTRGFWMSAFEVTQAQWARVSGGPPARQPSAEFGLGDDYPIYWVSYLDAVRFCELLTRQAQRAGELPAGSAFRLPTEAQWEYACRAGTTTATAFGDEMNGSQANFLFTPRPGEPGPPRRAVPAGAYPANRWGLHDMHGNIFEWCRDWYHARLPGGLDPDLSHAQGVANRDGTYSRVRRGGAWNDGHEFCRSAFRLRYEPERSSDHIGFRVVAVPA